MAMAPAVGRAGQQPRHQGGAVRRQLAQPIARLRHGLHRFQQSRGGVEADAIADAPIPVGIIGEDQRDPPLAGRRLCQTRPARGKRGHEGDSVRYRLVGEDGALRRRIEARLALEADGARQDAPVHFRQGHLHGEIARRQALAALAPFRFAAAGEDELQHRHIRPIEGRGRPRSTGRGKGKGRPVQDDRWLGALDHRRDEIGGPGLLEARGIEGKRVEARGIECRDQRIDDGQIPGLEQRPVEDDGGDGAILLPAAGEILIARQLERRASRGRRAARASARAMRLRGR